MITEQDALAAFQAAQTAPPDLQPQFADALERYKQQQDNLGAPLFPTAVKERRAGEVAVGKMFTDPMHGLTKDKLDALNQEASTMTDPEGYKARVFNTNRMAADFGKTPEEIANDYENFAGIYSKHVLGADHLTDAQMFERIAANTKFKNEVAIHAMESAYNQKPWVQGYADWQKQTDGNPSRDNSKLGEYQSIYQLNYDDAKKHATELDDRAQQVLDVMREQAGQSSLRQDLSPALDAVKDLPDSDLAYIFGSKGRPGKLQELAKDNQIELEPWRKAILAFSGPLTSMIEATGESIPTAVLSALSGSHFKAGDTINRGENAEAVIRRMQGEAQSSALGGMLGGSTATVSHITDPVKITQQEADKLNAKVEELTRNQGIMRRLAELEKTDVAPIQKDKWSDKIIYGGLDMAGFIGALALPGSVGVGMQFNANVRDSTEKLRQQGNTSPVAESAGLVTGAMQALLDGGLQHLLPTGSVTEKVLSWFAKPSLSNVERFAARAGITLGQGQLFLLARNQGTELVTEGMFKLLGQEFKGLPWEDMKNEVVNQTIDGFLSFLPLAVLGAVPGARADTKAARRLLSDTDLLKAAGFSREQIDTIHASPDINDQVGALRSLWKDRKPIISNPTAPSRIDQTLSSQATAPADLVQAAEVRAWQNEIRQRVAMTQNADASIKRVDNEWHVTDQEGNTTKHNEFDDAFQALTGHMDFAKVQRDQPYMEALREMAKQSENGQTFQEFRFSKNLQAALDAAEKRGDTDFVKWATERFENYKRESGDVNAHPVDLVIRGESVVDTKGTAAEYINKLYGGAKVLDLIEERSEGVLKRAIEDKKVTLDQIAAQIREIEQHTGDTYMHGFDAGASPEQKMTAVVEAFSNLTKAYSMGVKGGNAITQAARDSAAAQLRKGREELRGATPGVEGAGIQQRLENAQKAGVGGRILDAVKSLFEEFKQILGQAVKLHKALAEGKATDVRQFIHQSLHLDQEGQHAAGVESEVRSMALDAGVPPESVAPDPLTGRNLLREFVNGRIDEPAFFSGMRRAGYSPDEIRQMTGDDAGGSTTFTLAKAHDVLKVATKPLRGKKFEGLEPISDKTSSKLVGSMFEKLDKIFTAIPNPLESDKAWSTFTRAVTGDLETDAPMIMAPERAMGYAKGEGIDYITKDLLKHPEYTLAREKGLAVGAEMLKRFRSGELGRDDLASLFIWGLLSRGIGAYPQEGGFIVLHRDGLLKKLGDVFDGKMKVKDINEWANRVVLGTAGAASSQNTRAFGAMVEALGTDVGGVKAIDAMLEAWKSNRTGPELRRFVHSIFTNDRPSLQIQNKVLSFIILVSGRPDVLVLDRVQFRHLWGGPKLDAAVDTLSGQIAKAKRLAKKWVKESAGLAQESTQSAGPNPFWWTRSDPGYAEWWTRSLDAMDAPERNVLAQEVADHPDNTYDRLPVIMPDGQFKFGIQKGELSVMNNGIGPIGNGLHGLAVYEALEKNLAEQIRTAYTKDGISFPGIGAFHWDSWLVSSQQAIEHPTIGIIAKTNERPSLGVTQGKFDEALYGMVFRYDGNFLRPLLGDSTAGVLLDTAGVKKYQSGLWKALGRKISLEKNEDGTPRTRPWTLDLTDEERGKFDRFLESLGTRLDLDGATGAPGGSDVGRGAGSSLERVAAAVRSGGGTLRVSERLRSDAAGSGATGEGSSVGAVTPEEFSRIAGANKDSHKFGTSVDVYKPSDYDGYHLVVVEKDGESATASVSPSGEIGSVTKSAKGDPILVKLAFDAAKASGQVKWLNGFDTVLPSIYGELGFAPVARIKFSDEAMPTGWSFENYKKFNEGRPDVVFMRYTGSPVLYRKGDGPVVESYDEGAARAQRNPVGSSFSVGRPREDAGKLEFSKQAMGMSQFANSKIALAGGFRDGTGLADVGQARLKYFIYDHTKQGKDGNALEVGEVALNVDAKDPSIIKGLVNIEIKKKFRGSGYGKMVIDSLRSTIDKPMNIYDVQSAAVPFWRKVGAVEDPSGRRVAGGRIKDWILDPLKGGDDITAAAEKLAKWTTENPGYDPTDTPHDYYLSTKLGDEYANFSEAEKHEIARRAHDILNPAEPDARGTASPGETVGIPDGWIDEGLNTEHPSVAEKLDRYTHDNDPRGIFSALKDEGYPAYKADLHRLLKSVFGEEIPIARIEGYTNGGPGQSGGLAYLSVSTNPGWGNSKERAGAHVRRGRVKVDDVVLAGLEAEGELIIKAAGFVDNPATSFSVAPRDRIETISRLLGQRLEANPEERRQMIATAQDRLRRLAEGTHGRLERIAPTGGIENNRGLELTAIANRRSDALLAHEADVKSQVDELRAQKDLELGGARTDNASADEKERIKRRYDLQIQHAVDEGKHERTRILHRFETELNQANDRYDKEVERVTRSTGRENEHTAIMRDMKTLDAVLSVLPKEVRDGVGGFLDVANYRTDEARHEEIVRRIEKIGGKLETYLRGEYHDAITQAIDDAQPKTGENRVKTGKLSADKTEQMIYIKRVAALEDADVDKEIAGLEAQITAATDPHEQAEALAKWGLVGMFSRLDERPAAELATTLEFLEKEVATGRLQKAILVEARAKDINDLRAAGKTEVAGAQVINEVDAAARDAADSVWWRKSKNYITGMLHEALLTTTQQLELTFGPKSKILAHFGDRLLKAFIRAEELKAAISRDKRAELTRIFGTKSTLAHVRRIAELKRIEKNTGVFIRAGRKTKTEKIPVATARDIIADPSKFGYSRSEGDELRTALDNRETEYNQQQADWQTAKTAAAAAGDPAPRQPRDRRFNDLPFVRVLHPGTDRELPMSRAEAMQYVLTWRQEDGKSGMEGQGWNDVSIGQALHFIGADGQRIMDWMSSWYKRGHSLIDPVHRRMLFVPLPKVENYAPILREVAGKDNVTPLEAQQMNSGMMATFIKGRVKNSTPVVKADAFTVFMSHFEHVAHWINYAEVVRDMKAVLLETGMSHTIVATHGRNAASQLSSRLKAIENKGNQSAWTLHAVEGFWSRLNAFRAFKALAYRISPVVKQTSAVLNPLLHDVPVDEFARGIGRMMVGKLDVAEMWKSPEIVRRIENGFSPEIRLAMQQHGINASTLIELMNKGMLPIQYTDAAWNTLGAAVAFDYYRRQAEAAGAPPAGAVNIAHDAVERMLYYAAQPTDPVGRSLIESSNNPFMKSLWMFASESRKTLAIEYMALRRIATGKSESVKMDLQRALVAHVVMGAVTQLMASFWRTVASHGDDEEAWSAGTWAEAILAGPINGLFVMGQAVEWGLSRLLGVKTYPQQANQILKAVDDIHHGATHLDDLFSGDHEKIIREIDAVSTGIGAVLSGVVSPAAGAPAVLVNPLKDLDQMINGKK